MGQAKTLHIQQGYDTVVKAESVSSLKNTLDKYLSLEWPRS